MVEAAVHAHLIPHEQAQLPTHTNTSGDQRRTISLTVNPVMHATEQMPNPLQRWVWAGTTHHWLAVHRLVCLREHLDSDLDLWCHMAHYDEGEGVTQGEHCCRPTRWKAYAKKEMGSRLACVAVHPSQSTCDSVAAAEEGADRLWLTSRLAR